jgi:HPt (histidine-containing phosphotransfer) domain-containing protein
MNDASDALLDELRREYRESAGERLRQVEVLLGSAGRTFTPAELVSLARHFHSFAGMGATYGFPRISQLGDDLEASIRPLVRSGLLPDDETVARWRKLVGEIAVELC